MSTAMKPTRTRAIVIGITAAVLLGAGVGIAHAAETDPAAPAAESVAVDVAPKAEQSVPAAGEAEPITAVSSEAPSMSGSDPVMYTITATNADPVTGTVSAPVAAADSLVPGAPTSPLVKRQRNPKAAAPAIPAHETTEGKRARPAVPAKKADKTKKEDKTNKADKTKKAKMKKWS